MKKFIYVALAIGVASTIFSCKKSSTNAVEKGKLLTELQDTGKYTHDTFPSGSGDYSFGIVFSVSKNGNVSELGCHLPAAGTYRITLWDSTAGRQILKQVDVTITANGTNYATISSTALTTGRIYLLTVQADNWYDAYPKPGPTFSYPITVGSVKILGYQWLSSTTSAYPTTTDNTYIAGFCDMAFTAD